MIFRISSIELDVKKIKKLIFEFLPLTVIPASALGGFRVILGVGNNLFI